MTTPDDDTDITTLMARTTARAVVGHIESIIWAHIHGDRSECQKAREHALEDLTFQLEVVFRDLDYTHEHPPRETTT
ncbi:MAG: hypothetical protein F4Y11_11710 [Chloroflexi bacterium]|nr:hypothetical protein [Chloroflexota bacterium]